MNLHTYLNIRHNLLVKRAGVGDWVEDNISRPVYDKMFGQGAYNKSTFDKMVLKDMDKAYDYRKTNPNVSPELAARANSYRNRSAFIEGVGYRHVPAGSVKYMPASYRSRIIEQKAKDVVPDTNRGARNVTYQSYKGPFARYNRLSAGVKIRKPRRLQPRKTSIEDYYAGRRYDLKNNIEDADYTMAKYNHGDIKGPFSKQVYEEARRNKDNANKALSNMDADLARRQQWRQQQAQQRQQRAQQQRAQYRAQRQQRPIQQPMQQLPVQQPMQQRPMQQRPMQQPMQQQQVQPVQQQ